MLISGLAGVAGAQISDPVPGVTPIGDLAVRFELIAHLPDSGSGSVVTAQPMTVVGDGNGRRFVADANGRVYQMHPDGSLSLFLDLATMTDFSAGDRQQGLSSLAFHPDYHSRGAAGEGKFYTSSAQNVASGAPDNAVPADVPTNHHSVIHEWTVSADPDAIDSTSAREVLRIGQPYREHNIGQIAVNPNIASSHPDYGLLYIALGDGGRPGDPHHNGQNLGSPLGTLLRIDPLEPRGDFPR